ncbi:hypothetical protein R3P82_12780 [Dietzia maris]|uniref:Uncharacterized protein n=1 Tax=Dietzia maris TaxID=37915 RepID=A0AAE4TZP9_9ACTN|nr:hypothetical protein [Dietzia maris]MDV6299985.1 hypothetical protein [Dietzia maris]
MVAVYIDDAGDVRSAGSDRIVAPAGTTWREARMRAALWAAAADALKNPATAGTAQRAQGMPAVAAPTPITAAPSYARTVSEAREVLAVIDIEQLADETAQALAALAQGGSQ